MYCIKQLGLTTIDQLMVAVVVYPYREKKKKKKSRVLGSVLEEAKNVSVINTPKIKLC